MAWYLNGALTRFRVAVNAAYPRRDKASDGTIGDEAHQGTNSDHNPDRDGSVDAWDMDVNLRSGDDPAAIEQMKEVFQEHPSSNYWIHNRQIASRSNGWKRVRYTGDNDHVQHAHWNTRESHEDSTAPWPIGVVVFTEQDQLAQAYRVAAAVHLEETFSDADRVPVVLRGKPVPITAWTAEVTAALTTLVGRPLILTVEDRAAIVAGVVDELRAELAGVARAGAAAALEAVRIDVADPVTPTE